MPVNKSQPKANTSTKKHKSASPSPNNHIDILVSGPLLIVPAVDEGLIASLEVYSPDNGHPVGAVFLPGVFFTDAELEDPACERWPEASSFSLLDPHSYAIEIAQEFSEARQSKGISAASIPAANHKVRPGRKLSADWKVAIAIHGQLASWSSHRLFRITDDLYHGGDAPAGSAAAMHRFTYAAVSGAEFCGACSEPRAYLRANAAQGGSLIILGEIPNQSTLLHERLAIDALARLAGLDLHLVATEPNPHKSRMMGHTGDCGHSIVLV